jgi:hypothetical protein
MISALSNATISAARGEATGPIVGSPSAAPPTEAEKTARLNADLSTRLDKMRAESAKFLNDGLSLKERLKGFSEFQATYITWANAWEAAGFARNRGFDQNDPTQADYAMEAGKLGNQVFDSELYKLGASIVASSSIPAAQALLDGKPPASGMLAHWDGLTADEQDIAFAVNYGASFGDGSRPSSSKAQFRDNLSRFVEEQQKLMAGPTFGGPSRAERLTIANDMMRHAAGDYKAWQDSRGNIGVVVDKIELSAEGAKAAAQTLSKEAPADDALDAQLKALETLKQINAQHRDWLKSIEESDKDKVDRPDPSDLPVQTQSPQPGSRLSVAA